MTTTNQWNEIADNTLSVSIEHVSSLMTTTNPVSPFFTPRPPGLPRTSFSTTSQSSSFSTTSQSSALTATQSNDSGLTSNQEALIASIVVGVLIALTMVVAKAIHSLSRRQASQNTTPAALEASSNEYSQNPTGQLAILPRRSSSLSNTSTLNATNKKTQKASSTQSL